MANKPKHFKATLERSANGLGWTIVRLPFDPHEAWTHIVRLRVCGQVIVAKETSVAFATSLFPVPGRPGQYSFLVTNRVQREAHLAAGSLGEFLLQPDLEPRPAELPEELASLLDEEPELRDYYDSLSESTRREIGKWLLNVKSDESRNKRAGQMAERLLAAMEGEQHLPPVIAVAFKSRPKAAKGWEKMTKTQQRQELLGVFYYQSIEARQRRVEKLCDNAEKRA